MDFSPAIPLSLLQVSRVWSRLVVNDVANWNDQNRMEPNDIGTNQVHLQAFTKPQHK